MPTTMEPDHHCPRCGTLLPHDAPEGLCPACLAKAGFDTESGATEGSPTGGSNAPPPSPQEIGRHFPHLEILELIGQGGMGIVYKARQPKLDRWVALKILPLESGRDPAFAERFSREARALARLSHPNIVGIFDFGEVDGLFYFLMEYVDGVNLRQLEQSQRLTPEQALAIVPKICDALQYAHEEGVVHRDIKPGNILIDRKSRVKIADFGLAKLLGATASDLTLTGTRHLMGTPHYMAPEQIDRPQLVDHRADIYSLGVVFYEMLTSELPVGRFAAPSQKVQVDVRLDDVVLRALENSPERRYQQASEVKTDVETITKHPPTRPAPRPSLPPSPVTEPQGRTQAERLVTGPGIALMVYAILNLVSLVLPLTMALSKVTSQFGGAFTGGQPGLTLHVIPTTYFFPISLLFLAGQICLLVGAAKLRNLSSYGWAFAAALIAILPTGPLWWIGIGLAIWTLIVIHRPEVRAAFERGPAPAGAESVAKTAVTGSGDIVPTISIKAIIGAGLIAVPLVMALLWLVSATRVTSPTMAGQLGEGVRGVTLWFGLMIMPLIFGFPVATTILGLLAITEIRHSRGRIVGLPLALFDALLFPLLVLDAMAFGLLALAIRFLFQFGGSSWVSPVNGATLLITFGFAICFVLDFFIVRTSWRAACRPPDRVLPAST